MLQSPTGQVSTPSRSRFPLLVETDFQWSSNFQEDNMYPSTTNNIPKSPSILIQYYIKNTNY